jgi:hypothetical protein
MNDSNNTDKLETTKTKSFTERFFELEDHANQTTDLFLKFAQSMQELQLDMSRLRSDLDGVLDSTGALISLMNEGKPVTKDSLVERILEDRAMSIEANVALAVTDKKIIATEAIANDDSMLAYKIKDRVRYAYNKVGNLEDALRTGLVGKKKGDMVENVEILGVYEAASTQPANS